MMPCDSSWILAIAEPTVSFRRSPVEPSNLIKVKLAVYDYLLLRRDLERLTLDPLETTEFIPNPQQTTLWTADLVQSKPITPSPCSDCRQRRYGVSKSVSLLIHQKCLLRQRPSCSI